MPQDIRNYIIGVIVFTIFIVGGVSYLSVLNNTGGGFTDDDTFNKFNRSFNKLADVTEEVGTLESGVKNAQSDFGLFGVLNSLIQTSWSTLKATLSSFDFMNTALDESNEIFGIPSWIPTLIGLIITIVIVFAIFRAIFNR